MEEVSNLWQHVVSTQPELPKAESHRVISMLKEEAANKVVTDQSHEGTQIYMFLDCCR